MGCEFFFGGTKDPTTVVPDRACGSSSLTGVSRTVPRFLGGVSAMAKDALFWLFSFPIAKNEA